MTFRDLTAIVTGAGQGMGQAIALELARAGARLAICDIQPQQLEETARQLQSIGGRETVTETLDVSDGAAVAAFVGRVQRETGSVDIVVNNAAIHPLHTIEEISDEEWDKVFAVNIKSCFYFVRAALPLMKERGFGRIINIASEAGKNGGTVCAPHYAATKGAVLAFTRHMAKQVGSHGITVNAIAPGRIASAMAGGPDDPQNAVFIERSPVRRLGDPVDVARGVRFLADPTSVFITGETLNINGGTLMD